MDPTDRAIRGFYCTRICTRTRKSGTRPSPDATAVKRDYRKTFNISRTLVCNKIVDHSEVVGASPVGAAPTTSSNFT